MWLLWAMIAAAGLAVASATGGPRLSADATLLYSADCGGAALDTGKCIYSVGANASHTLAHNGTGKVSQIAVDERRRLVYWTDRGNDWLWAASIGESFSDARVMQTDMGEPRDLAVRHSTGALYWTDKKWGRVYVSYDQGATRATLANGLLEPMGIALDDAAAHLCVAPPPAPREEERVVALRRVVLRLPSSVSWAYRVGR